ncbi:hypothetical protein FA15DRAFT_48984 [Coprinopsis marcescibilis]|uniref:Uncharacterized protein n=1 Tax=Coprinopsis marcescibilis TaxID=230819 RepID=A0A5C3KP62_COPMA|nr:hypothetical protein FA15DRAFT_48984 [Coprinopsis marcescibilis]
MSVRIDDASARIAYEPAHLWEPQTICGACVKNSQRLRELEAVTHDRTWTLLVFNRTSSVLGASVIFEGTGVAVYFLAMHRNMHNERGPSELAFFIDGQQEHAIQIDRTGPFSRFAEAQPPDFLGSLLLFAIEGLSMDSAGHMLRIEWTHHQEWSPIALALDYVEYREYDFPDTMPANPTTSAHSTSTNAESSSRQEQASSGLSQIGGQGPKSLGTPVPTNASSVLSSGPPLVSVGTVTNWLFSSGVNFPTPLSSDKAGSSPEKSGISIEVILGTSLGGLALLCLTVLAILLRRRRSQHRAQRQAESAADRWHLNYSHFTVSSDTSSTVGAEMPPAYSDAVGEASFGSPDRSQGEAPGRTLGFVKSLR